MSDRGPKRSAGILLYRLSGDLPELLIVHPGGPYFVRRDLGVWSVPKGELDGAEDLLTAARREFEEEIGSPAPDTEVLDLGEVRQKNGKVVRAYAVEGDLDAAAVVSNTFEMEWPPRSGQVRRFPEIDRAEWCAPEVARQKLVPAQAAFVERLIEALESRSGAS
jgi:predicted NUDIX family NTP pyrophosphohydrolase